MKVVNTFNVTIDTLVYGAFLSSTLPVLLEYFATLGASLPPITVFFLKVCGFWTFFWGLPLGLYVIFCFIIEQYITLLERAPYYILIRLPVLISCIGSLVFIPLPSLLS
ncbi:MAG: hypothetical protein SVR94_05165 [Pseudomonadota bacterium]|nr:hypothetical protein [Pseudomonadota bacterium]